MMSDLDTKYSNLVDALTALNSKFNSFINGDENTTIQLDSGTVIKSIAGTTSDLNNLIPIVKGYAHKEFLTDSEQELAYITLPKSTDFTVDKIVQGTLKSTLNAANARGSYFVQFKAHLANGIANVILDDISNINVDAGFLTSTKPVISVDLSDDGVNNCYRLKVTPFSIGGSAVQTTLVVDLQGL